VDDLCPAPGPLLADACYSDWAGSFHLYSLPHRYPSYPRQAESVAQPDANFNPYGCHHRYRLSTLYVDWLEKEIVTGKNIMRKLEIVAVMFVLMSLLGLPAVVYAYEFVYLPAQRPGVITVIMRTAEHGNISPRVIRVKKGDVVQLRITSEDVAHGFRIKEFDVKVYPINPGKFETVEFVAEEAGTFNFVCNITCSPRHNEVKGQLIVEE